MKCSQKYAVFILKISGQENNSNEDDVIIEGEGHLEKNLQDQDASTLKELEEEEGSVEQASITLTFKDNTELSSLRSALSQLLQQVSLYLIAVEYQATRKSIPVTLHPYCTLYSLVVYHFREVKVISSCSSLYSSL